MMVLREVDVSSVLVRGLERTDFSDDFSATSEGYTELSALDPMPTVTVSCPRYSWNDGFYKLIIIDLATVEKVE